MSLSSASTESAVGFRAEIIYGVTADPQNGSDTPRIQQAYAAYRAPILGGIEFRLGRWDTPLEDGYGRGIAAHPSFRSHCAQVVEAGIERGRRLQHKHAFGGALASARAQ